jgi:hypothetical protein
MKQVIALAAFWKKVDIIFQCVLFLLMLVAVFLTQLGVFGLYLMALGQLVSAVMWFFSLNVDTPKLKSANFLRFAVMVIMVILGIILVIDTGLFLAASMFMLWIGPVVGFGYFIITIVEYRFYTRVRKPYYLL